MAAERVLVQLSVPRPGDGFGLEGGYEVAVAGGVGVELVVVYVRLVGHAQSHADLAFVVDERMRVCPPPT